MEIPIIDPFVIPEHLMDIDEDFEDFYGQDECEHKKYYLGTVLPPIKNARYVLDIRIPNNILYSYTAEKILEYVCLPEQQPTNTLFGGIEIVQVFISRHNQLFVLIKTFWLRIIQRRWKRLVRERKAWLANVKQNILGLVFRSGQLPPFPNHKGMLSEFIYQKSSNIKTD